MDTLNEADALRSLIGWQVETRCTLEIYIAKYEEAHGRMNLIPGEDLWRDQQMGAIRTKYGNNGNSTTHVLLPRPFIIPADELLVKKRSKASHSAPGQNSKFGLADQYVVKIWLEAPSSRSQWPPMDLQSSLDSNGRMAKWLRDGTFSSTDIRLVCKGVLFPGDGAHSSFDMVLKLGGLRINSHYALRLDIQCSVPPQVRMRRGIPNVQGIEAPVEAGVLTETESPDLIVRTRRLSSSEIGDIDTEDNEPAKEPAKKSPKAPLLTIPRTKRRLCDAIVKNVLAPGEKLGAIDDNLETTWRTAKHVLTIEDRPDISSDTKDYIQKWNLFVAPLKLSSSYYVPRALITFVEENKDWFAERKARITEFSLHATSLRLRGIVDVECFAKCIHMLRDCIETHRKLELTNREVDINGADGATNAEDFTDTNLVDGAGTTAEAMEAGTANEKSASEDAWNEDTTIVDSLLEEVVEAEPGLEDNMEKTTVDEDEANQNASDQNEVLGDAMNEDAAGDIQRLTPERDASEDFLDDDLIYEDATEELKILGIDDYFDAENGEGNLQQPFYLDSYWQSLTQRWPRLKLHPREHFGIATVIAAIAIFQGFPDDNIDRLIALHIDYCPNENIQDLVYLYHNAGDIVPTAQGVFMTEFRLHKVMWEATRETCEIWLTDVYRLEDGSRRTVREAIETATNADAWDKMWKCIAKECGG
jgi:VEFS-Box of polycomb protein